MLNLALAATSPQALELAFYEAIRAGDLDSLMNLWADQDDVICIHPGIPRLIGHAAIRDSFATMFERFKLNVHPRQLHVTQIGDCAIHNVLEEIVSKVGAEEVDEEEEDEDDELYLLATNVYYKTELGWRIFMHHVSIQHGSPPNELPNVFH